MGDPVAATAAPAGRGGDDPVPALVIGRGNVFRVGSRVQAARVGNSNEIGVKGVRWCSEGLWLGYVRK